jgi:hypothetical protein
MATITFERQYRSYVVTLNTVGTGSPAFGLGKPRVCLGHCREAESLDSAVSSLRKI